MNLDIFETCRGGLKFYRGKCLIRKPKPNEQIQARGYLAQQTGLVWKILKAPSHHWLEDILLAVSHLDILTTQPPRLTCPSCSGRKVDFVLLPRKKTFHIDILAALRKSLQSWRSAGFQLSWPVSNGSTCSLPIAGCLDFQAFFPRRKSWQMTSVLWPRKLPAGIQVDSLKSCLLKKCLNPRALRLLGF